MGYRAHVSVDPLSRTAEVRLIREANYGYAVAGGLSEDGFLVLTEADGDCLPRQGAVRARHDQ